MADDRPTFGSLFAGIGGIDLGLERAGWRGRWQVEYEPFCQRVLAKHWPDVTRFGDIHDVDWSTVEPVDLVAGGFPCQPFSVAGKQRGMDDDRWLWPEFELCLRALRPRFVLVENVPGLLMGRGMDAVLGGLAELGYDAEWESIPAAAVGAPHLRYRVWIIGTEQRRPVADPGRSGRPLVTALRTGRDDAWWSGQTLADAAGPDAWRGTGQRQGAEPTDWQPTQFLSHASRGSRATDAGDYHRALDSGDTFRSDPTVARGELSSNGRGDPPARRVSSLADTLGERGRGGDDHREHAAHVDPPGEGVGPGGYGGWWATEPDVGRVAHGVPARVDRLRALGNAVVPQVVEFIGRRILEAEGR